MRQSGRQAKKKKIQTKLEKHILAASSNSPLSLKLGTWQERIDSVHFFPPSLQVTYVHTEGTFETLLAHFPTESLHPPVSLGVKYLTKKVSSSGLYQRNSGERLTEIVTDQPVQPITSWWSDKVAFLTSSNWQLTRFPLICPFISNILMEISAALGDICNYKPQPVKYSYKPHTI